MLNWKQYREIRKTHFGENRIQSKWNYHNMYVPSAKKSKQQSAEAQAIAEARVPYMATVTTTPTTYYTPVFSNEYSLAPLPTATCPPKSVQVPGGWLTLDQQGINPMKTMTTSTDLTINTTSQAQPSDASKARDFLMSEYQDMTRYTWQDERYPAMRKLYNIDAPTVPETSQGIIDAFKNGKVVIDQAKIDKQTAYFAALALDNDSEESFYEPGISSKYFGITFTDLPVADRKGYADAVEAYEKLKTDTRRKLAILDPEAGLEILTAFEAWKPTLATATAH